MDDFTPQTTIHVDHNELQALLHLATLAQGRMSIAEQLYYDTLLTRWTKELAAQVPIPEDAMKD